MKKRMHATMGIVAALFCVAGRGSAAVTVRNMSVSAPVVETWTPVFAALPARPELMKSLETSQAVALLKSLKTEDEQHRFDSMFYLARELDGSDIQARRLLSNGKIREGAVAGLADKLRRAAEAADRDARMDAEQMMEQAEEGLRRRSQWKRHPKLLEDLLATQVALDVQQKMFSFHFPDLNQEINQLRLDIKKAVAHLPESEERAERVAARVRDMLESRGLVGELSRAQALFEPEVHAPASARERALAPHEPGLELPVHESAGAHAPETKADNLLLELKAQAPAAARLNEILRLYEEKGFDSDLMSARTSALRRLVIDKRYLDRYRGELVWRGIPSDDLDVVDRLADYYAKMEATIPEYAEEIKTDRLNSPLPSPKKEKARFKKFALRLREFLDIARLEP